MKTLSNKGWLLMAILGVLFALGCSSPMAEGLTNQAEDSVRAFSQSWDNAFFRGTANGWSATAMELIGDNYWSTTQDFTGQSNPRFKIDRFGDWSENYPTGDVSTGSGEWVIVFNDLSKAVSAVPKAEAQFSSLYFRGTPNGWSAALMTQVDDYTWEITQDFSGQSNPRFKLDRFGNWNESYPSTDFLISEPGVHTIRFDSRTKAISLVESSVPITQTPSLSPSGGSYSESVTVNATGEAVIHYTTDGSTPDENDNEFPAAGLSFDNQGDVTLKVRALAPGKDWSSVAQEDYTILGPVTPLDVYIKSDSTPIIWAWEVNGRNISQLEGFTWNNQESMVSEGAGWYKWSVPASYLPLTGDLGFKINQSNPEHFVSVTSWNETPNNANSWVTVDPRVPSAPTVSLSPAIANINLGGSKTVFVTIEDNGSPVTTASYSIDGFTKAYTGGPIILEAGARPDGAQISLSVWATNGNGTGSASGTYTVRDYSETAWRDFREENVYFMMTDRFADGDTTNNNLWGDEYLPGGESQKYWYDESKTGLLTYYHGGDFQGILNNLDYLQDMGFTSIWITPVVKQPEGRYYYDGSAGGDYYEASAFHGYWAFDFDQIDPHLHSSGVNNDGWDDFSALADELHNRGMKLMLDIVVNHGHPGTVAAPTQWADVADTVIMDGQTFSYANDPYKDEDDITKGFYNYIGGYDIAGLVDFNERGPAGYDAREHLKNIYKRFIDAGVDAFRIDTVAYMTDEWWGEFADAMFEHAQSLGNEYFYMVGESWTGRGTAIQRHSMDTTDSFHMLDMQASTMDYPGQMHNAFKDGGDYAIFANLTSNDPNEGLDAEGATWTGMFVDNHDVFRSNGIFNETQYKNALTYIYLFRGVPIVYYGTEAMYSWSGAHASTNKDDIVARWMLGQEGINHVKNNQPGMYQHLKMLNNLRLSSESIQKGIQENIVMSGDAAVFTRDYQGDLAFVAVSKGAGYSHTFTGIPSGTYRVLTPGSGGNFNESTVNITSGSYTVNVSPNSFVILD